MRVKIGDRVLCVFMGVEHYGVIIEGGKVQLDKGTILPNIKTKENNVDNRPWHIVKKVKPHIK